MSCCFGKNTDGTDPKKSMSDQSDPQTDRPIIPVNTPQNPKIEYSITVKTGDFRNSGTNGPVYIKIFGRDNKQTEDILLSAVDKFFAQSCTRKFQINAIDIGKPQRIIIRHEDNSTGWYIDYVEISVHNFLIRFVANRWLNRLKNDQKLEVELFGSEQPAVMYNIEVQTGDQQMEPLDSPVYMQIYGTTTTTPKLFLESKNTSFTKDSLSKFSISSNNIGEIQRIIIGHEGLGKVNDWYLKSIKLQMLGQQQEYIVEKLLSPTQGDQGLFVELSEEKRQLLPPMYLITIQTADVSQSESIENIEMIVRGSDGQIAKKLLKDYAQSKDKQLFQRGNLDEFQIEHKDIGNIESITIGFSDSKQQTTWLLEYLDIKYKDTSYHFRAQCWLSSRLGPNFSWMTIKPDANNDDINYQVLVETGQSGVDANVILCIFGDADTTTNLALKTIKDGSDAKFEKDTTLEFDLKAVDVGKIKKINIGHDGKGSEQQWYLKSIHIEKNDEQYTFQANRWLGEEKDDHKTFIDLSPDEQKTPRSSPVPKKDQSTYIITVVTSSDDHAGTDSGVLMTIIGDKDITKQFQLANTKQGDKPSFDTGTTNEFEMELDDVGNINKINIGQDGKGSHPKWHLESVQIQKGSENYNFIAKKILDQSTSFIDLTPIPARKTPSPEPVQAKAPSPEPVQAKAPSPEPIKPKSPSPEPVKAKAPSPEPVKPKSPSPEPVKAKAPSPKPVKAKAPSPEPVKVKTPRSVTPEQKAKPIKETTYKVIIQTGSLQKDINKDNANFYLIIHGENDQTKKLSLKDSITSNKKNSFKKDDKTEFELKTINVGKISKIIIGQNDSDHQVTWHVDNVTIKRNNETTTFNAEQTIEQNSQIELLPSPIPKKPAETTYKILIRTGALQEEGNDSNLNITIFGQNGQTKKFPLNETTTTNKKISLKKNDKIDFEFKTNDVGKLSKIVLNQDTNERGTPWHIDNITIKRNNETTTFNVERQIEQNTDVELTPSPIPKKPETPRKRTKSSDTISKVVVKPKDTDYDIIISTGDESLEVLVTLKIRGENGIINIPLTNTKTDEKPFQSKSTSEFSTQTTDVGKIRRITLEHNGTDKDLLWHLKTIQIKKGNETYNFNADIRLDYKVNKINLYPVGAFLGHQREDYVQSELRRLRENLRSESSKLHPPIHKAYEPFVYNDLGPYFDTSPVERAIYSPLENPPGYYTRLTALRIVEPWEAYGMDYGVNYEILKQRKSRSFSSKRPLSRSVDDSFDRKQGSTHLPKFPCVSMRKPAEYSRALNMNDVPKIRSFIRSRYTAQADVQVENDYKRTHDDIYRMQLDNLGGYHISNRDNMVRIYHSYLENTPGAKKALHELCQQIDPNNIKTSVDSTV